MNEDNLPHNIQASSPLPINQINEMIPDLIPDIIAQVNSNKVYVWLNRAGIEFYGTDAVGKEASYFFEGDQNTYQEVENIFSGKKDMTCVESWQRRKDNEKRLLIWWCRSLKDANGKIVGALSTAHDVTERKHREIELMKIKQELENKISELEKMNSLMVNREIKMAELKKEIEELKNRLNFK